MKKTLLWIIAAATLAAATFGAYRYTSGKGDEPAYRFGKVERGPITAAVAATGTLNPVKSVLVGSQVSGQIKELFVDFNSVVKQDQVIARIDPESFELRVRQAMADLEATRATVLTQMAGVGAQRAEVSRSEVNLADVKRDYERKQMLVEKGFVSTADRDKSLAVYNGAQEQLKTARAQLAVAEAQAKNAQAVVKQRESQLAQARVDLDRTIIRAPVDGVVIKRSVDAGQTVAASLQAPELFQIAQNLREMQVEASIDEADVGRTKVDQSATFTVDSFPGRTFSGKVMQVRKAALVVQNVVTYIVVISAANPDLQLLPGMTANVRITTDQRDNVLRLPNAALRFRPAGFSETGAPGATGGDAPAAAAAAGGNTGQQLRARLVSALDLDAEQQAKLEPIFADLRQKLGGVRELPEADRAKAGERARIEMRARIMEILRPEQKRKYEEIVAESTGRASGASTGRGRVFVADAGGTLRAVNVRTGLSDGSMTEIATGELKEGDQVVIGTAQAGSSSAPRPSGPRLPF
ncbi:MAG: HlyD family efflux transporter periplasmic adaptor subunit [Betaproteobacteria bacterium]|nr:MAG: HlyD family efflux transporter periplasmic adaptor subunit [Betaproteobacteria bacterium]